MSTNEIYMQRCIQLALKGAGKVAPNPMVGAVVVYQGEIIGEGYHENYGAAHAEVNAIGSVHDKEKLKHATIYVSLEPCNHYGKTPPCSDLIVSSGINNVVIGCVDSFEKVAGAGLEKLKNAGISVTIGVLEKECRELNKRFFTFHEKKRPYIFLKWAQTQDAFISRWPADILSKNDNWISGPESKMIVHQLRANEQAILVGTNTAKIDNPELTTRLVDGKNPLRIAIDKNLVLPQNLHLFDHSTPTLVINKIKNETSKNLEYLKIDEPNIIEELLHELHNRNIISLIVEGGALTLNTFIDKGLWDEAFIFSSNKKFNTGISAPCVSGQIRQQNACGADQFTILRNL